MYNNPLCFYDSINKATMSGREIEALALTKASLMLKACQDNWEDIDIERKLEDALKFNQLIWSIFQSELINDNNPLPKKLRLDIIKLGSYIDKQIFQILSFPSPEKLRIIIDINNSISNGLRNSA